jgi:hypothetical protein
MTPTIEIDHTNQLNQTDFEKINTVLLNSLLLDTKQPIDFSLENKGIILKDYIAILEKCLTLLSHGSSKEKIKIVDLIDKLILQKERIDLKKGNQKVADLKIISKSFGHKAQSAFQKK